MQPNWGALGLVKYLGSKIEKQSRKIDTIGLWPLHVHILTPLHEHVPTHTQHSQTDRKVCVSHCSGIGKSQIALQQCLVRTLRAYITTVEA